jgi:bacillithiol system protein YtxJ
MANTWIPLQDRTALQAIFEQSAIKAQLLFKHSTRCSISDMAKGRLERAMPQLSAVADVHYLDLIQFRDLSNLVAEQSQVHHESPQVILLWQGECVLDQSHYDIQPSEILAVLDTITHAQ